MCDFVIVCCCGNLSASGDDVRLKERGRQRRTSEDVAKESGIGGGSKGTRDA